MAVNGNTMAIFDQKNTAGISRLCFISGCLLDGEADAVAFLIHGKDDDFHDVTDL